MGEDLSQLQSDSKESKPRTAVVVWMRLEGRLGYSSHRVTEARGEKVLGVRC